MEKKQLNLSAPLISARRYSSPLRSSGGDGARDTGPTTEQPEMNMGEVVKPGSVPFVWEQIPGKAKSSNGSGSGSSRIQSPDEVPSTPKLPPAFLNGRKSGELSGFRTPTTMLSGELGVLKPPTTKNNNRLSGELNTLPPRPQSKFLSGELHMFRSHTKLSGELGILSKYHYSSFNSSEMIPSSDHSDNDDNDDANTFSDAHDTFSQLESSSVNCSISGLSGSDRPDTKHCHPEPGVQGSVEPRTRDFMMNRFLPAAKAMTLEPSQYSSSRKHLAVVEQPKVVPRARTPPPGGRNVCHIVPYTGQDIGAGESDDEEEEETESGCEEGAISVKIKACGFLPWFCSKNSIRLLNPLPSMKSRSKSALSSASRVGNLVKNRSWKSSSPKLPKHVPCVNHKNNKVEPSFKSCELQKPPKYTPRPMFYSGELPTTRSGSPYRNSSRRTSSPYRTDSPHHNNTHTTLYQKGVGVLSVPKRVTPCDENRAPRPAGPRDAPSKRFDHHQLRKEETMYIDSVNIAKVSHSILNLPKTNRSRQADNHNHEVGDLSRSGRLEIMKARGMSGPLLVQRVHNNNNNNNKYYSSELTNTCRELVVVGGDDDRGGVVGQSPLINPPLPKSPSESWLSRKLPAVSPRNSVSYSKQAVQSSRNNQNAKWENIVKSSHSRHDLGRYSEELVTHVPQRQQTWK